MPIAKGRSNKRSSSSSTSYASTVTTVIFIALCVLGLWILTSNSVVPPQTTTTSGRITTDSTDTTTTTTSSSFSSSSLDKKDPPAYEDNPGNLPDDAIKGDTIESKPDEEKSQEGETKDSSKENSKESEREQEQEPEQTREEETKEKPNEGNESVEEQERQTENENQISEESSITENHQETKREENRGTENIQEENQQETETGTSMEGQQQQEQQQGQQEQENSESNGNETEKQQPQHEIEDVTNDETQQNDGSEQSKDEEPTKEEKAGETQEDSVQKETNQEEVSESNSGGSFIGGDNSGIPKESKESRKSWSTQADQSENQNDRRKDGSTNNSDDGSIYGYTWKLCNVTAGADYIPCLDNEKALRQLHSTKHYEHRERHCPDEGPTCLVPLPQLYKRPVEWPKSRDKIWYNNVPHTKLAEVKGHQNWVKVTGEFLTFPGGGTQFIHGALHYIDFIQQAVPNIGWGKHSRVVLDVGCGVASFGGYLFERDVLTMSFAPKDEHEAQVQFALERGIPAISAVMGSQRLPFPGRVFDVVHCARCRVPWHAEGGALLLELNRVLRPGGYFVWSATPVYQKLKEDVEIWKAMSLLTVSMCWELVTIKKDKLNSIGAAIYRKPNSNECYGQRKHNSPPMCKSDDDPNAAWYVPLQSCIHPVPVNEGERGTRWPEEWPRRLQTPPYWLNRSQMGIYGKPAPDDFASDYEHWKRVLSKSYLKGLGISWTNVRNVMDMRAVYGGFAAALKDLQVWVLNVVNVNSPDTLPIIYERGLFGIYHDWCESFSTYPRTYDLLHADHLFSRLKKRCKILPVVTEIDRLVRPGGKIIVRDESVAVGEVENILKSLHWEVRLTFSKDQEGILSAQKSNWRPDSYGAKE